jgi:tRNA threonylcarbamoyladenosine biosynthesis protein TsaE
LNKTIISHSAQETINVGIQIGKLLKPGNIIALKGNLAAGKTTFTKGIAISLGITDEVTSPTYTLISEYEGYIPLYPMDRYRIDSIEEFELLGADEMLFGHGISIIEWSERIEEYLPENHIIIDIQRMEDETRNISIKGLNL